MGLPPPAARPTGLSFSGWLGLFLASYSSGRSSGVNLRKEFGILGLQFTKSNYVQSSCLFPIQCIKRRPQPNSPKNLEPTKFTNCESQSTLFLVSELFKIRPHLADSSFAVFCFYLDLFGFFAWGQSD